MVDNKFPLIEKARAWFHRQPSAQQKNIKKYGTIGTFVIIALGIYYLTGQDKKKPVEPPKQTDVAEAKTSSYVQDDIVSTLGGQIKDLKSGIDNQVKDAVADAMAKGQFSLTLLLLLLIQTLQREVRKLLRAKMLNHRLPVMQPTVLAC